MPFQIVKYKGGFRVKKIGEARWYSKRPLTKEMAQKQKTAMELRIGISSRK